MVLLSNARHMAAGSPGYANGIRNPSASAQALTVPDDIFAAVPVETPTASSRQVSHSLLGWAPPYGAEHSAITMLGPASLC